MELHGNLSFLGGGELKNLRVDNLAANPESPNNGQLWINTTAGKMRFFDGTTVIDIADDSALANYLELAGGTMTGALSLSGAPTLDAHAVTKLYTDDALALKEDSLGYVPINKAGDAVTGNLNFGGTKSIIGLSAPVNAGDAATKAYVDASLSGLDFQPDVIDRQADATLDPGTPTEGDRYIIGDASALHANFGTIAGVSNGDVVAYVGSAFEVAYDVSAAGAGAMLWSTAGVSFYFYDGTIWSVFGGLAGVTAGVGLVKAGNTMDVNMGAGVAALPTDEVGIDLRAQSGMMLTLDGTTDSVDTAAQLTIKLNGSTLALAAAGLGVADGGITEAHFNASVAGNGLVGGAGTALAIGAGDGVIVAADEISLDTTFGDARYATLAGATFTGDVELASDPTTVLGAVTKQYADAISTSFANSFFVQDNSAAAATSHVVSHNTGQKYCNVTVVDASDQVIIPNSITFDTANQLTVAFTASTACRVIVGGVS